LADLRRGQQQSVKLPSRYGEITIMYVAMRSGPDQVGRVFSFWGDNVAM
jgi:hypothetical protein